MKIAIIKKIQYQKVQKNIKLMNMQIIKNQKLTRLKKVQRIF